MLRQLATLTRRVPAAGPRALAVAVYGGPDGQLLDAKDNGVEGVACVDDAARACGLLCRLWAATGNRAIRAWAEGLLDFVLWMRAGDGGWLNFVYDWEGSRNVDGPTSAPGVNFWQARATCALADAACILGHETAREALGEALATAAAASPPSGVRTLHALAAIDLLRHATDPWLAARLVDWCDEIASTRSGVTLLNYPEEPGRPHLWGHVQEAALIDAGAMLGREDLREAAVESANSVFVDVIRSGFDLPQVRAYDVQSAVFVMDRLAQGTGDSQYGELGRMARNWFAGRNSTGVPTYNQSRGRVFDGIDGRKVNPDSGAESNVAAGLALLNDPMVLELARTWVGRGSA